MAAKVKSTTTLARQDDGSVQLTFILPWSEISLHQDKAIAELTKDTTVPGFRKGKAPIDKAAEHIDKDQAIEMALREILPGYFAEALREHKINPIMYPKFELIKAAEGEDWEVRATTAEMPAVNLKDYKKRVKSKAKSKIWTPKDKGKAEPTEADRQDQALNILMDTVDLKIPAVLIDEEVTERLSSLLQRLEKLGLSLESYLQSLKKTVEELRAEYRKEAEKALKMDLLLTKIAVDENLNVSDKEVEDFVKAAEGDPKFKASELSDQKKDTIRHLLRKQAALQLLSNLIK